ncbi:MAG: hypothetical protein JSS38_05765 [Nitrospira sp.]|nr:hypothetical protein [Nitrospira sp.]
MIILGLHFGHDAGVAVLRDGQVVSCVIRERQTRVKHAMTLDLGTIREALHDADVAIHDVNFCAVTSTQGVELIVDKPKEIAIYLGSNGHPSTVPCTMNRDQVPAMSRRVLPNLFAEQHLNSSARYTNGLYSKYFPEYRSFEGKSNELSGWIDEYTYDVLWRPSKTLKGLSATRLSADVKNESLRFGFHYPVSLSFEDCLVPAFFINHHMCHASSSYYQSGFRVAAIFSQDGGSGLGYDSGMFYYGEENRLYPIAPHHSILGVLYDLVAFHMNLGESSAGKLMGLSAYGRPVFYDRKFVGNKNDLVSLTKETEPAHIIEQWLYHCLSLAKDLGYDLEPFGDVGRMTAPVNADIAASTQKLFEENVLALTEVLHNYLRQEGIVVDNLCLSGGSALNCPANSRVVREARFKNVFVEPGCDDSGLAIGAVLNCYYNLLDQPLLRKAKGSFSSPSLGPRVAEAEILSAIESFKEQIIFEKTDDWARDAAYELESNRVIGWFYGRSEVGPRALGHRSILADARDLRNWERVNKIKRRELWRPFAPAVLESESEQWFSGIQLPSPYMLFNATVKSKDIPAVTHVDGSARVQTVNEGDGAFYDVLVEFFRLTKVPILLNTSFNGPGEPIVETPFDAVKFFIESELDVLYLDSYKLKRIPTTKTCRHLLEPSRATAVNVQTFMAEIEEAQCHRRAIPFLVEANYSGFNIVLHKERFWGVRRGISPENHVMELEELQASHGYESVIVCDSVDAVCAAIDRLQKVDQIEVVPIEFFKRVDELSSPLLVESRHGFNLVRYREKIWVVDQSAGSVDFLDPEQLQRLTAAGQLLKTQTVGEAQAAIDRVRAPYLVESKGGFNIISYKGKGWVVDQSAGEVDFYDREQLRDLAATGRLLEMESVEEARTVIDRVSKEDVSSPHIVESQSGFNIISHKGKAWVVDQSVGVVEFHDQEQLQRLMADGFITKVETLSEAKAILDENAKKCRAGVVND